MCKILYVEGIADNELVPSFLFGIFIDILFVKKPLLFVHVSWFVSSKNWKAVTTLDTFSVDNGRCLLITPSSPRHHWAKVRRAIFVWLDFAGSLQLWRLCTVAKWGQSAVEVSEGEGCLVSCHLLSAASLCFGLFLFFFYAGQSSYSAYWWWAWHVWGSAMQSSQQGTVYLFELSWADQILCRLLSLLLYLCDIFLPGII